MYTRLKREATKVELVANASKNKVHTSERKGILKNLRRGRGIRLPWKFVTCVESVIRFCSLHFVFNVKWNP